MRKRSVQTISEVEKVWHRVMAIKYRAGNCAVRIPSSNELAQEFGIARSSVRIALERLTADGVLITRKGCGTFINPKKCTNTVWEAPLIGLMILKGDLFFFPQEIQGELECLYGEIRHTGWNVREVTGHMSSGEETRQVLQHAYLNGLITFGSEEFAVKAADAMLPTVNMGFLTEGVSNVITGCSGVIQELFRKTGRETNIRVWTSLPENSRQYLLWHLRRLPGIRILYGDCDIYCVDEQYFDVIREQFAEQCPDWILIHPLMLEPIRKIVIGLYGEERARKILWIYVTVPGTDHDWPAYFFHSKRREETRSAIRLLKQKLEDPLSPAQDAVVEAELLPVN